jgi:DNA-binding IclR family transcriptional regulator
VPIRVPAGQLAGTLNVTGPSFRLDRESRRAALAPMRTAAARIEAGLG